MKQNRAAIALVLAGGGITGAVYEIGALRAIDELLVNHSINDFDIYVGTSAGALVTAFLANGLSSIDLMRVVQESHPLVSFPTSKDLFRLNTREILRRGLGLPRRLLSTGIEALSNRGRLSVLDIIFGGLGDALPSGIYDSRGLGDWVGRTLDTLGCRDSFTGLSKDLLIIATQLGDGRRAVFSAETSPEVPISEAVAASSAVPVHYKPVRIGDREFLDGGLRGTASLDLAIERGAKLVVCINPLVPFDGRALGLSQDSRGGKYISDRGLEAVMAQTTRVLLHSGLKYHIKQLQRRHPDVDIILIEPRADDPVMFFANIMRLKDRIAIAEHGFRSVSVDLAGGYEMFKETLARYDIPISRSRLVADLEEIRRSEHDPEIIKRVLERSARNRQPLTTRANSENAPIDNLRRTLSELEERLDGLRG